MTKRKNKFGILKKQQPEQTDYNNIFPEKVSLDNIRKIWNDDIVQYTDEQLFKIREWVYSIASVIIHIAEKQEANKGVILPLTETGDQEHKQAA